MKDDLISRRALMDKLKTQMKQITPIEESRDMFFHDSGVNGAITGAWLEAKNAPAIDAVPVVRCKDCKHGKDHGLIGWVCCHAKHDLDIGSEYNEPEYFCADGERRDNG